MYSKTSSNTVCIVRGIWANIVQRILPGLVLPEEVALNLTTGLTIVGSGLLRSLSDLVEVQVPDSLHDDHADALDFEAGSGTPECQ